MQCHVMTPLPGATATNDPRIRFEETAPEQYGIIHNYPVHSLIDPKTGNVIFSREQIWESFNALLRLREKHLGLSPEISNKPRI